MTNRFPGMFYDRLGVEIEIEEYAHLLSDIDYKVLVQEDVLTPHGKMAWVSTVWIGSNMNFLRQGPPLIFETMIFWRHDEPHEAEVWARYPTEGSAREGHALCVAAMISGLDVT